MPEFSAEMRQNLYQELVQDAQRIQERCILTVQTPAMQHREEHMLLEQLVYITEQMRLKLKILGAPRIYN